jgi:antitoxin ParD1/3/4
MTELERLTIALPHELTETIKAAINEGDYASASEVVRDALRDWKTRRESRQEELAKLKADIDQALNEVRPDGSLSSDPALASRPAYSRTKSNKRNCGEGQVEVLETREDTLKLNSCSVGAPSAGSR